MPPVTPDEFQMVLDLLEQQGIDVSKFRDLRLTIKLSEIGTRLIRGVISRSGMDGTVLTSQPMLTPAQWDLVNSILPPFERVRETVRDVVVTVRPRPLTEVPQQVDDHDEPPSTDPRIIQSIFEP